MALSTAWAERSTPRARGNRAARARLGAVGRGFADLGDPVPIAVVLLLAALAYLVRGVRGLALVLVGPPAAMIATSLVLKPLIDRTHRGGLAFPSGHTTAVASTSVAAGVLLLGWVAVPFALRWIGSLGLLLLVVAVGTSLVGRGYHYPTDTVGGVGVALAVVLVSALLIDAVADLASQRAALAEAPTLEGGLRRPDGAA